MSVHRHGLFHDFWRGNGAFVSFRLSRGYLLFAVRWRWRLAVKRPEAKPGVTRVYIGPFEIEWTRFS